MWSSPSLRLTVKESTRAVRHPPDVTVLEESGSLSLHCSFTYDFSLHPSLVTWWTVSSGETVTVLDTSHSHRLEDTALRGRALFLTYPYRKISTIYLSLSLADVLLEDDGNYTCHARYCPPAGAKLKTVQSSQLFKVLTA